MGYDLTNYLHVNKNLLFKQLFFKNIIGKGTNLIWNDLTQIQMILICEFVNDILVIYWLI